LIGNAAILMGYGPLVAPAWAAKLSVIWMTASSQINVLMTF